MIVAGIDEAGFGPVLGPLVVSATAFSVADELAGTSLWELLSPVVVRKATKRATSLAIADSKELYKGLHGGGGLDRLERGVLAMIRTAGRWPTSVKALMEFLSPGCDVQRALYPWYGPGDLALPHAAGEMDLTLISNALSQALSQAGVTLEHAESAILFEGEYNRIVRLTNNKSSALLDITCRLLMGLWERFAAQGLRINVDRQGGRMRYLPALERVFEGAAFKILDESETVSAYRITAGDRQAEIWFSVASEKSHLPVALASMICKYVRELFMTLLNGFWAGHVPGIKPTAGYYTDGSRFFQEILPAVRSLGYDEQMLWRER